MSNNSTVTVACALCVGTTNEPYLAAALASIAPAVDRLVVNDNSLHAHGENVSTLERSAFAERGALRIARHPFVDFADMRNRAFAELATLPQPPDWVLFLDADEVHGEQIRYVAREILPRLSPAIGNVDAYTYHFFGTYRWITDIARRFVFYRYRPELRWVNRIHERIVGIAGEALVLPYAYHHYGNVAPPALLARKHTQYYELGNAVPRPPTETESTAEIFLAKASDVRRYTAPHPQPVRATLAALQDAARAEFAAIDAGFERARTPSRRIAAALSATADTVRIELRRVQHPALYRAPTRAR
ncbi:MAG: hypothetical protein IAI50_09420 [Candidatus Eremiobacteraeota bacterium]|nr:hypothetical protein [Candidatus Eremiobacteraeota bacterium]